LHNTSFLPKDLPNNPLSCLYAASGLNNADLGRALLEAGTNPNDNESLHHSTEHPDLTCMKLLLGHGAKPNRAMRSNTCWITATSRGRWRRS
jgi:hypothetical protein